MVELREIRRRIARLALVTSAAIIILQGDNALPDAPKSEKGSLKEALKTLIATWKAQQSEIVTGQFEVTLFRVFDPKADKLSAEDVGNLFRSVDERYLEKLNSISDKFPQKGGWIVGPWNERRKVLIEGQRIRNDTDQTVYSFTGTDTVYYMIANRQADINPGKSPIQQVSLREIKYIPNFGSTDVLGFMKLEQNSDNTATVRASNYEATVNIGNGFVYRCIFTRDGKLPDHEVRQYLPREVRGISLPTLTLDVSYVAGKVRLLSIYRIDKAVLNQELDADAFKVAIPKGVQVLDYRENKTTPAFYYAMQSVPDVSTFPGSPESRLATEPPSQQPQRKWWQRWLFGWIAILLLLAFSFYWNYRRIRKAKLNP
jgi:hypothetical protein